MADIGQTDFSLKPDVNIAAIASLYQKQATDQQAMKLQQSQIESQQQDRVMNVMKMASDMTQGLIATSAHQQIMQGRQHITDLLGQANDMVPSDQKTPAGSSLFPQLSQAPVSIPKSQTPEYQTQMQRALLQANPEKTTEAMLTQQYPKPATSLEQLAARAVQAGVPVPQSVTDAKASLAAPTTKQTKNVRLDGSDAVVNYVPGRGNTPSHWEDDKGNKIDSSRITPIPSSGQSLGEIRKASLINSMNQQLPKAMNPEFWTGNSQAALSARLVNNAESAKLLADQILSGQVPANKQTMSILQADAARVVAQQGVITNEGREELSNKTGYSSFADALQYFTNHPEDRHADDFIKVLKNEMNRQQQFRQGVVDKTQRGTIAQFNELKRLSPTDWEQGLDANGIDVAAAKQGHFKLKNTKQEPQSSGGNLVPTLKYNPTTGDFDKVGN